MVATLIKSIVIASGIPSIQAVQLPDGQLGATLRSLCRALSINFSGQLQHIRRKDSLAPALVTTTITTKAGKREVAVLLAWAIPVWLTELEATRLGSAKREVILLLQRQAVQAIYQAFWVSQGQEHPEEAGFSVPDHLLKRVDTQEARLNDLSSRMTGAERLLRAAIERLLVHERGLKSMKAPASRKGRSLSRSLRRHKRI